MRDQVTTENSDRPFLFESFFRSRLFWIVFIIIANFSSPAAWEVSLKSPWINFLTAPFVFISLAEAAGLKASQFLEKSYYLGMYFPFIANAVFWSIFIFLAIRAPSLQSHLLRILAYFIIVIVLVAIGGLYMLSYVLGHTGIKC